MLKSSRAYFCHTVAEGSPLNRIASNLFNQARQSIENVFRRPGRIAEGASKQSGLQNFGGRAYSGGLVAKVHASSRGLITKFAERNLNSELINAMKKKYGWSGGFRSGIWGQKLSTFAFVGIGVAAGAQWNTFEEKNYLLQDVDILEFFGKGANFVVQKKPVKAEEQATLPLRSEFASFELEPLNLSENDGEQSEPSFIRLDSLSFEVISDEKAEEEIQRTTEESFVITQQVSMQPEVETFCKLNEKDEQILTEQLNASLAKVEEQRVQLESLRCSIVQLNELLYEMFGPQIVSSNVSIERSFVEIDIQMVVDDRSADLRGRLIRSLSVIGQQQLQLNKLKQQLFIQNQQLKSLCEAAATCPAFATSDALHGPGAPEAW